MVSGFSEIHNFYEMEVSCHCNDGDNLLVVMTCILIVYVGSILGVPLSSSVKQKQKVGLFTFRMCLQNTRI